MRTYLVEMLLFLAFCKMRSRKSKFLGLGMLSVKKNERECNHCALGPDNFRCLQI